MDSLSNVATGFSLERRHMLNMPRRFFRIYQFISYLCLKQQPKDSEIWQNLNAFC